MEISIGAVDVGGLLIGYRRAGTGPALVLLHGGFCDGRVWRAQLESLSDDFTVVAWDAPSHGRSGDPDPPLDLEGFADRLAGFIEALGLGHPHVLGHSFGGGLALQLGARHPGLARSLVIAGGYAGWGGSLPAEEVDTRLQLALAQSDRLPVAPDDIPGLGIDGLSAERRSELASIMADVRPSGMRMMARAFAAADLRDDLARVEAPVLLLYGDADERAPTTVAEAIHTGLPRSTLVYGLGYGHEWYYESPATFDAEVRRFLESVP